MTDYDRFRSCEIKVPHASAAMAWKVAKRAPYKKGLQVYHCRYCGAWHVGNDYRSKANRKR
jgi:hypothetical protein